MLLEMYGPLDNAPSWRYREADAKVAQDLEDSAGKMAQSLVEQLTKADQPLESALRSTEKAKVASLSEKENGTLGCAARAVSSLPCVSNFSSGNSKLERVPEETETKLQPTLIFHQHSGNSELLPLKPSPLPDSGRKNESECNGADSMNKPSVNHERTGQEQLSNSVANRLVSSFPGDSSFSDCQAIQTNKGAESNGDDKGATDRGKQLDVSAAHTAEILPNSNKVEELNAGGGEESRLVNNEREQGSTGGLKWSLGTSVRSEEGTAVQVSFFFYKT
jgi:hypothetical protein